MKVYLTEMLNSEYQITHSKIGVVFPIDVLCMNIQSKKKKTPKKPAEFFLQAYPPKVKYQCICKIRTCHFIHESYTC